MLWDSIFVLFNQNDYKNKKKDILYLLNSRVSNQNANDLIKFYDFSKKKKCKTCQNFEPYIILKNCGEGLYLLKKFIEKYDPWITAYVQSNIYDLTTGNSNNYDNIFLLITKTPSYRDLYDKVDKNKEVLINCDIRIKNNCLKSNNFNPWLILKRNSQGLKLAKTLINYSKPFFFISKQKQIYLHNIPEEILKVKTWTKKNQSAYGNLKIEI